MNHLIIIDDKTCKQELNKFIESNSDHIKLLLTEEEYNVDFNTLIQQIHHVFDNQRIIFLKTQNSIIKVTPRDILFIQAVEGNIKLNLASGSKYNLPDTIEQYASILSQFNILQINKKTLINTEIIESFIVDENILYCKNDLKFLVDEDCKEHLINELNQIYK